MSWSQNSTRNIASFLKTLTSNVDILSAASPSAGQLLTAVDSTHATWQAAPAGYTDEQAQDAVGSILTDSVTIDFTYDDAGNQITADVKANSVGVAKLTSSATDKLFGRSTAGAGAGEEIVCTAAGRALIDDADTGAQRTTLGLGSGDSPTWTGGTFTGSVSITGNLAVAGATISSGVIELEGNYATQNSGYSEDTPVTGGFVRIIDPTTTQTTGAVAGFVLGIAAVSDPTVAVTSSAGFAATDIIDISGGGANDGLYEVYTAAANVLTVRGVGLHANVEAWSRSNFSLAVSAVGSTITKVNVAVDRTGTDGKLERAYGNQSGLVYSDYYYVGGDDVAVADGGTGASDAATARTNLGVAYGSSGSTVCVGNDSRLSDTRAPSGAAGGGLYGTYPNPVVTTITDGSTRTAGVPLDASDIRNYEPAFGYRHGFVISNLPSGTPNASGCVVTARGTASDGSDAVAPYEQQLSSGAANSQGGWYISYVGQSRHGLFARAVIKTPAAITSMRLYVGWMNAETPTDAGPTNHAVLRYSTDDGDTTNGKLATKDGTTQSTQADAAFAASTRYVIDLWLTASLFSVQVNGGTITTKATNLPTSTVNLGFICEATSNAAGTATRAVLIDRIAWSQTT